MQCESHARPLPPVLLPELYGRLFAPLRYNRKVVKIYLAGGE